ncbi:MAG: DUF2093 domain-containing protein [Devosiaceae bacterium]|nr:DUF2093 domain-containing protein [Devosiaceae bacterium MH13]
MVLGNDEREAVIRYETPEYHVLRPGDFVVCAITFERIPLSELKYWSVARQEPYRDAAASLEAERRAVRQA